MESLVFIAWFQVGNETGCMFVRAHSKLIIYIDKLAKLFKVFKSGSENTFRESFA
jgi:hypothetical protein